MKWESKKAAVIKFLILFVWRQYVTGGMVQNCGNWLYVIVNQLKTSEAFIGNSEWEVYFAKCEGRFLHK